MSAREQDSRVEITGERTEDSTSWANPDGTLTTEVFSSPIRVREDGSWTPVDTTLTDTGSTVTPGATAADLSFSDGGSGAFAQVADGSKALGLSLVSDLPTPTLDGNTATYRDAVAGGDLVVTALPTGFSERVVLDHRPEEPLTIRIPLTTSGGLKASQDKNGHLLLTDASGKTIADAPAPHMWDSAIDDASGLAAHDAKVDSAIEDTADGQVLVLSPDTDFLNSPDLTYPLTIDPTTTLAVTTDTWLETPNYTDSQRGSTELRVGTYDSGTHRARAYLQFDTSAFVGTDIVDTDLSLYSYYSSTCSTSGTGTTVRRITTAWSSTSVTWDTRPSSTATGAVVNTGAHGYSSSCPAAWSHWDIDAIVQSWADGTSNYGLMVYGTDETDSLTWRRYYSANYTDGDSAYVPRLTVTYKDAELADITDSASLTTSVVAQGTVDNADGTVADGADVILYAWPNNEADNALEEEDSVKLQPVAKAVADSSGAYKLRIASLSALAPLVADDGTVNFEIFARADGKMVPYNFSRRLVTSSSATRVLADTAAYTTADASTETTSALQAEALTATLTLGSDAGSTAAEDSTAGVTEDPTASPSPVTDASAVTGDDVDTTSPDDEADAEAGVSKGCISQLKKKLTPKKVIVGQTYSKTTAVAHSLTYTNGASSTLGVGVSASGTYGSYASGGTNSKSTSSTTQFPTYGNQTGVYYKTYFNYGKYLVTCTYADSGYWWTEQHYEVRARSHAGGAMTSSAAFPSYKYANCFVYTKGSSFTKTKSSAITWTNGASLSASIGIDLSVETGYTSDATVSYTFNQTRMLCGTHGTPGGGHPANFLARKYG